MNTRKKNLSLPLFSSKEKRKKTRTEGLSKTLQEFAIKPTQVSAPISKKSEHIKNKNQQTFGKKILCFLPFFAGKEKRKKMRTESVSQTLYGLGLNYSSTQDQYIKTRERVKNETKENTISSSLSSSLPVSLL